MPNWKMRAKALVEGRPTTRPWQDAELRVRLDDAHHPHDRGCGHEAVGVERDGEFVLAAPALAEVPEVSGLEAGVDGAAAVGDRECGRAIARRARRSRLSSSAAISLTAGVAQDVEMEASRPRRRASISRIMASRLRITRSGGSLRTKIVIAVEAAIGFVAAQTRDRRQHGRDRIAGEAHDEEADGGVPEADHRPRHGEPEEQQKQRVGDAEAAGRQRIGGQRQQDRDGSQQQASRTASAVRQFSCQNCALTAKFVDRSPRHAR